MIKTQTTVSTLLQRVISQLQNEKCPKTIG
jgi:hypothetical protein